MSADLTLVKTHRQRLCVGHAGDYPVETYCLAAGRGSLDGGTMFFIRM